MKAPDSLGGAGKRLWKSVAGDLPKGWELDQREVAVLTLAARQMDDLARLDRIIAKQGAMAMGSTGQPVVHPAISEARQARLAIGKLLGQLALPDGDEEPATEASRRGRRAAQARWDRKDQIAQRRRQSEEGGRGTA